MLLLEREDVVGPAHDVARGLQGVLKQRALVHVYGDVNTLDDVNEVHADVDRSRMTPLLNVVILVRDDVVNAILRFPERSHCARCDVAKEPASPGRCRPAIQSPPQVGKRVHQRRLCSRIGLGWLAGRPVRAEQDDR